jgi:hypothetical protein
MDMLLEEGSEYARLGEDVVGEVKGLLEDAVRLQDIADAALDTAMGLHTYDHRVDELFEIAGATTKRDIRARPEGSPLAGMIDLDAEVQRIAQFGAPELADQLPDREVWDAVGVDAARLGPGRMEAVALRSDDVSGLEELIGAARRYVYIDGAAAGLEDVLDEIAPQAVIRRDDGLTRVDLMAPSYRIMPFELEQT